MRRLADGGEAIVARGLELRYDGVTAVGASDLDIPRGGVAVIIGPNGSGKSTLLAAMAGLHQPAGGTIRVLGSEPSKVRERIALVLQATKVNDALPVTVREVVGMGRYPARGLLGRLNGTDRESIDRAMTRLGLERLSSAHLPELSGGQRQRVFVAQGLVQEHEILLLDEPLTALDMVSSEVISEAIAEEREQGMTVVVTTHDMTEARRADHVVVMSSRVMASGLPEEALTPQVIAEAYGVPLDTFGADGVHVDDAAHLHDDERHVHVHRSEQT